MKGMIKRIFHDKGFGFLFSEENHQEYFFHRTSCPKKDFMGMSEGDGVEFREQESDKGPRAEDVTLT